MDRRRRQWVPVAVDFHRGRTGSRLHDRFGHDGLLVWVCYLLACKTNWVQGELDYYDEADGWARLGLNPAEFSFTLEEFFAYTGDLHLTARRRRGDVITTSCRPWNEWNTSVKRAQNAEWAARQRGSDEDETTTELPAQEHNLRPTTPPLYDDDTATIRSTENEGYVENDVEGTRRPPDAAGGGRPRPDKPARLEPALSFLRNGAADAIDLEPPALRRYLADEYNLGDLDIDSVLEAAGRAQASEDLDRRLAAALEPSEEDPF